MGQHVHVTFHCAPFLQFVIPELSELPAGQHSDFCSLPHLENSTMEDLNTTAMILLFNYRTENKSKNFTCPSNFQNNLHLILFWYQIILKQLFFPLDKWSAALHQRFPKLCSMEKCLRGRQRALRNKPWASSPNFNQGSIASQGFLHKISFKRLIIYFFKFDNHCSRWYNE